MRRLPFSMGQPMSARLQSARMATMDMPRTHARLTDTTALTILPVACLLARVRGSMASTVVAASTADGADTMAEVGMETVTDSVAKADGMVVVSSTGTKVSTAAEVFTVVADFKAAASAMVTGFMVAGCVGAELEASTVVAGPTGEATGNCYRILLSNLNGWQLKLPAVFFPLGIVPLPGNAIPQNGIVQSANREIGDPGLSH
jgi:hypothetical protein